MKRSALVALIAASAAAPVTAIEFDAWLRQAQSMFAQTPQGGETSAGSRASALQSERLIRQSPFTFKTELSRTQYQDNPALASQLGIASSIWSLTSSLAYLDRSSFGITLSATAGISQYQAPTSLLSPDRPYTLRLQVDYDLIKGGSDGLLNSIALRDAALSQSDSQTRSQDNLDNRLLFVGRMVDYFMLLCKERQLKEAQDKVSQAVAKGRVEVKSKIISYKDFYNFQSLENNFELRLQSLEQARRQLLSILVGFGQAAQDAARRLTVSEAHCDPDLTSLGRRADDVARRPERALDDIARRLPGHSAAQSGMVAAEHSLRSARLEIRPSLSPYVAGQLDQQSQTTTGLGAVQAGIVFQWNIPGERGDYSVESASLALEAAKERLKRAFQEQLSRVQNARNQIIVQKNVLGVVDKSMRDSLRLLEVLRNQRKLGLNDSLNFSSAYLNYVDISRALYDTWGGLEKTLFEYHTYQDWNVRPRS